MADEIRVCSNHQGRPTPLRWTFAFPGAEYWCPYCGYTSGMFGAGYATESTPALEAVALQDEADSKDYLHARGVGCCSQTLFNGKWVKPADLPQEEKDRLAAIIKAWVYPYERSAPADTTGQTK